MGEEKDAKKASMKYLGGTIKTSGDIGELGSNVYMYGTKIQGDRYVKTTEAIGNYVGRMYGKAMKKLVIEGIEAEPDKPVKPTKKTPTAFDIKEYDKRLDFYFRKQEKYEENKAKVFIVIMGQCTLVMKNKVMSCKDYKKMEEEDDVVELLKIIKTLCYQESEMQYEYLSMQNAMQKLLTMKQGDNFPREGLVAFYKRFKQQADVTEDKWGMLTPAKKQGISKDRDEADKFLAICFLAGVSNRAGIKLRKDLHRDFVKGHSNYPENMEEMLSKISNYSEQDQDHRSGARRRIIVDADGKQRS